MERELPSAGFSKLSKTEKDAVREHITQLYAQLGVPAPVSGRSQRPQLGIAAAKSYLRRLLADAGDSN